ncbi:cytochrome P450 [Mycobacterium avium 09-5983]|nr:cytochrome P450 [Mycobacterium avium 09-5983]
MPPQPIHVPPELVVDYDVYDDARGATLHDELKRMRATTPVAYTTTTGGYWVVTRYEDAREVLRRPNVFSSSAVSIAPFPGKVIPGQLDPPEHTAYRQVLAPLFSPKRMLALEDDIRSIAISLIDEFAERGSVELLSQFAHPLPSRLFLALMGWPQSDAELFTGWTRTILSPDPSLPLEEQQKQGQQAAEAVFGYFSDVLSKRSGGGDDVTSVLAESDLYPGQRIETDSLLHLLFELMLGGLHTVRGTLGFGLVHLANNPDQRQKIIDDPSLIPGAVEEILRLEAPVSVGRLVTEDVTVGGVPMKAGDKVLVVLWSANRDESKWDHADQMDVERKAIPPQCAFSAGPHRCPGSHLARVELRIALEELHRRIPDYRLDPSKELVFRHGQVRAVDEVHLVFTPSSSAALGSAAAPQTSGIA